MAGKPKSRLNEIEKRYNQLLQKPTSTSIKNPPANLEQQVKTILKNLDHQGRWISIYHDEPLVGQPKFPPNIPYLSSEVFSRNLEILSTYLNADR